MLNIKKYIIGCLAITGLLLVSCDDDFAEINSNPESISEIEPETFFTKAIVTGNANSFEAYYSFYRRIMPWTQLQVPVNGNSGEFTSDASNMNSKYGTFYGGVGKYIVHISKIIENKENKEAYLFQEKIADIYKIYYAWYVSDTNGNMPWTEAFEARYGGTLTPKYETQEELFEIWDTELKEIVNVLSSTQSVTQKSFDGADLYYGGDVNKWIKAANTLRLKIAMRLSKRNPTKLKEVATEVLASDIFTSIDDDWVLVAGNALTEHGNFNPDNFVGSKSMIDFMVSNEDPRTRVFFRKNDFSQENIDKAIADALADTPSKVLDLADESIRYVGATTSPDMTEDNRLFLSDHKADGKTLDTLSSTQERLWKADFNYGDEPGSGNTTLVNITYADLCFMRAELAVRGITSEDAETWYNKGIEASIQRYDRMADFAGILEYSPVTSEEISTYISSEDVAFDSSKGLEQIAIQYYLTYFKQPNEAWASIKRLGMPNSTTTLGLETLLSDGSELMMPRRVVIETAVPGSRNYENQLNSINQMKSDSGFGNGESDIFGRIWWDME